MQNLDREICIWTKLKHQYVLPLYGTVEGFGLFRALVSPWMPNGTLDFYLNRTHKTLSMMDKLRLVSFIHEAEYGNSLCYVCIAYTNYRGAPVS
jgi:hypothetical protein